MSADDARISPTAHYTGYAWYHNGLSHPALVTRGGRLLHAALHPSMRLAGWLGLPTVDGFLLARHREIDRKLDSAITSGAIGQVVEIASGLSPRGWDFSRRYGARVEYIEADLPAMAERKRDLLRSGGLLGLHHRVISLDALADDGPQSLAAVASELDPSRGLAILTEGLINYFPRDKVIDMWRRFARVLAAFHDGLYLSDLHLQTLSDSLSARAFAGLVSTFVRGNVHLHFGSIDEAERELRTAGFSQARVATPPPEENREGGLDRAGAGMVWVLEARTSSAQVQENESDPSAAGTCRY